MRNRKPIVDIRRMKICRLSISGVLVAMSCVSVAGHYALRALGQYLGWRYDTLLGVPLINLALLMIVSWRCDDDCS